MSPRPAKPEKDRRSVILKVCLTKAERKELDAVAQKAGMDTSTWLRVMGLEAARK